MKQTTMLGLAAAFLCTPAFCDWIQIGVPANSVQTLSTNGQSLTITDPGRPGSGTFTLTATSGTAGGALIGRDFGWYPTGSFSNFLPNGLDPTGADQFVVGTVSGCSGFSFAMFRAPGTSAALEQASCPPGPTSLSPTSMYSKH